MTEKKTARGGTATRQYSKTKIKEMADLAKRMILSGKKQRDVSEAWKELGFFNQVNGLAFNQSTVSSLLRKHGFRMRHTKKSVAPANRRGNPEALAKARAVRAEKLAVAKQNKDVYHGDNPLLTVIADLLTAPNLSMEARCTAIKAIAQSL
jgi:hypothetical protein